MGDKPLMMLDACLDGRRSKLTLKPSPIGAIVFQIVATGADSVAQRHVSYSTPV